MKWPVVVSTVVAIVSLGYVHVALPAQTLISDYALVSGGLAPVMLGMLALGAGCVFLAYGLAVREPSRSAATRVLLVFAAAGLMLSAVFPTDPGTGVGSLAGEIHRWGSAVVFTALPVAGWVLARGRTAAPRWHLVRSLSLTSALTLGLYLAAHPASITSGLIGGVAYYGLLERGLVVAEIVLVAVMAVAASREAVPVLRAVPSPSEESRERLAA
ncbi:DUF998 domain-containing protein [Nonomuraea sp. NPDC050556]|uniref:DUF998 domain-containing protein n=1 Tax=Nonomuraea sp. NPDC050556 TaxID=3364369 RepID=UPI0037A70FC9